MELNYERTSLHSVRRIVLLKFSSSIFLLPLEPAAEHTVIIVINIIKYQFVNTTIMCEIVWYVYYSFTTLETDKVLIIT